MLKSLPTTCFGTDESSVLCSQLSPSSVDDDDDDNPKEKKGGRNDPGNEA